MRKPVPEYYKILEEKYAKFVTREELLNFIEKEEKGAKTPLKYPREGVYYRRTAIDRVIITSLTLITYLTLGMGIVANFYISYMYRSLILTNVVTRAAFNFTIAAYISKFVYQSTMGNRFFVVIEDDEDVYMNLKRKSSMERRRIFKTYPECKELYMSLLPKEDK